MAKIKQKRWSYRNELVFKKKKVIFINLKSFYLKAIFFFQL